MDAAKIYKRVRILMIPLLIIMTISGCIEKEEDTKPIVTGGNPPLIKFQGTGSLAQLFVRGPYTLEELRQRYQSDYKITGGKNALTPEEIKELERIRGNKDYSMWQLDPSRDFKVSKLSVTYGIVPNGFKQVYPANGKSPEPLIEGKIYTVLAPSASANFKSIYFMIDNGRAVEVPPDQTK
jgi:hypothetical protein